MIVSKYPRFIVYCFSLNPLHIGHMSVYLMLPSRGIEVGASAEQAALVISLIGALNIVGRIFFGWISDFKQLAQRRNVLLGIICITTGSAAFLCAFFPTYWLMIAFASVFGIGSGKT